MLLIVVTVNAINFIDGLDGLAAGIIGIGSLAFFAFAYLLSVDAGIDRATTAALLSAVLAGLCAGFLPHNFNPARIFMGDSGALLLGLLMAVSTSVVGGRADTDQRFIGQTFFFLAPLVLPLFILGVPVLDLDYEEDSQAGCDGNFVLTADGSIVEAQVTAEGECYDEEGLLRLLRLARIGCAEIFQGQLKATGR